MKMSFLTKERIREPNTLRFGKASCKTRLVKKSLGPDYEQT